MYTLRQFVRWALRRHVAPMHFPEPHTDAEQHILFIGDSKTCPYFVTQANEAFTAISGKRTDARPYPLAISGATVVQILGEMKRGALEERSAKPDYILINLGTNDVHRRVDWSAWGIQYATMLGILHRRWLQTPIYIMRPFRTDRQVECNQMADIIGLLAECEPYVFLGPDEREFLAYADRTRDGIHPTEEGYQETARQWASVVLD